MKMSFISASMYRADFTLRILRSVLEIIIAVLLITTFFSKTNNIVGWSRDEAMLVMGIALFVGSIVMLFWGNGIEGLHRKIIRGALDQILVQPMDSQWLASTKIVYITNIFRVIFNSIFIIYVVSKINISFSILSTTLFIITLISAIVIYYSIMFAAAIISFWSFSGEVFYLFNSIASITRYPIDIFSRGIKLLLTFFPVVFIATIPASVLLNKPSHLYLLSPLIATFSLILTRKFWSYGLRHYESASS